MRRARYVHTVGRAWNGEREREREGERRRKREREKRVPANKKRAAMHSLYSLDINTRQRARNQPRLHRQLLPNDTDTHTRPLIVIKQKKERQRGTQGKRVLCVCVCVCVCVV